MRMRQAGSSTLKFVDRDKLVKGAATIGAIGAAGALTGIAMAAGAVMVARSAWNAMTMSNISGKVALITGGSRGLGLAIAHELARQGCKVVICARKQDELDAAALQLRRMGAEVLAIQCDVARQDDVEAMVRQATAEMGGIDILINNAGVIQVGPIEAQTIEDFREAMDVMFWGPVYTTLAVLPQMKGRHSGWIANVTSIGGKIAIPHLVPYSAAKFAAVGLSEGLTAEVAKDGIKVTTIVPGLMRTGSHENAYFKGDHRAEYSWFSLGASSPVVSINATRAARSIVNAIRRGQAEVILSIPAKVASAIHGVMPGTTGHMLGAAHRVMPGTGSESKERHRGLECESKVSSSLLTKLGRDAAARFNQRREVVGL